MSLLKGLGLEQLRELVDDYLSRRSFASALFYADLLLCVSSE
jgi:hypothetical protein